jgi:hypothetical protein
MTFVPAVACVRSMAAGLQGQQACWLLPAPHRHDIHACCENRTHAPMHPRTHSRTHRFSRTAPIVRHAVDNSAINARARTHSFSLSRALSLTMAV